MPAVRRTNIGRRTRHAISNRPQRRTQSEENPFQQNPARVARARSTSIENQQPRNRPHRFGIRMVQQAERAAFNYNNATDYSFYGYIGTMTETCQYCKAEKFPGESDGMCCAGGKVKLPALDPPPDPLRSLLTDMSPTSKHFLKRIQDYNNCFQMTSFGATNIVRDNFMPTFKVIN